MIFKCIQWLGYNSPAFQASIACDVGKYHPCVTRRWSARTAAGTIFADVSPSWNSPP